MKMNNYIRIVVILMLYIIKCINSSDEYNDYTACNKVDEETASRDVCNAITIEMEDMYCCYVTYKDKHSGSVKKKCRLIEITEHALNQYVNTLDMHEDVKVLCESTFHSVYVLYSLTVALILLLI
jgi:hypothetical protein